jgi:hypothetical protein
VQTFTPSSQDVVEEICYWFWKLIHCGLCLQFSLQDEEVGTDEFPPLVLTTLYMHVGFF